MTDKPWWKTAFNESYLTAFDDYYSAVKGEKEAVFLIQVLSIKKGTSVLDLACGQGRHAIALAQNGMKVTGLDTSAILLNEARKRAQMEGVTISFVNGDMRSYHDINKFEVVLVLGNSFGYFSDKDNENVLSNISTSLQVGGWLVLDLPNTPGMLRRKMTGKQIQKNVNATVTTRTLNFNPETFRADLQWQISQNTKKVSFSGKLRLYTPPEINHLLSERGLVIRKTYGSFSDETYNIDTQRYLVVAQKI